MFFPTWGTMAATDSLHCIVHLLWNTQDLDIFYQMHFQSDADPRNHCPSLSKYHFSPGTKFSLFLSQKLLEDNQEALEETP